MSDDLAKYESADEKEGEEGDFENGKEEKKKEKNKQKELKPRIKLDDKRLLDGRIGIEKFYNGTKDFVQSGDVVYLKQCSSVGQRLE